MVHIGGQERSDRGMHEVMLLTRAGCCLCDRAKDQLAAMSQELGFTLGATDVDAAAAAGDPALRTEYGDRLPVVLLDGREHSYWEVDEQRLRADLSVPAGAE
ncbi:MULTISPECIES: glutaredoxin family protein [unclassified Mycobacterium]|uniref:glutaredoxin family protein n=1 Tax=unclassified Mycobacterium TaxID=2642494 RepID=UPI0029C72F8A|nr:MULTISPECIES: glutaredoxin family protein [unclassified Mycobacterium]